MGCGSGFCTGYIFNGKPVTLDGLWRGERFAPPAILRLIAAKRRLHAAKTLKLAVSEAKEAKTAAGTFIRLFANYEQATALCETRLNRIVPAPQVVQAKLSYGMSLLIEPSEIDAARSFIESSNAEYHTIVPLAGQTKPRRDKYCEIGPEACFVHNIKRPRPFANRRGVMRRE